ncbi:TolC family protein [Arenimonas alkanexedens]
MIICSNTPATSGRPHPIAGLRSLALAVCLAWLPPAIAQDSPAPGADVASIRTWLIEHNPDLRALQAEAEAAEARVLPAGALPDPMAGVRLEGIDPDQPTLAPANVGNTTWTLRQDIPLWGKRGLARDAARDEAQAARLERDAMSLTILADAEQAYVAYWQAEEAVAVVDRLIALLDQMEEVARVRYSLGVAAQQDAIRAQVARTRMQAERIERLAGRREAVAMLNAALGRPADAALANPAQTPMIAVPADSLDAALAQLRTGAHPAIAARAAMASAASRATELQRRQRYPDLSVGLGAMQRGDRIDGYELMFEVGIPLQRRALRERERAATLAGEAAQLRVEAAQTTLQGQLGGAWAQWDSARERRRLFEQTLLPQSQANFESALASYRVGDVDFGTLLESLEAWQGADLSRLDAWRDELSGAAVLRALLGSKQ